LTLKKTEYIEKWAYELAKTYYKAGMDQECVKECSDIILWFGEGVYVEKAKILRSYFSGETNKEKIMEELRRRSMEDTTKTPVITESPVADEGMAIPEKDRTESGMQMGDKPEADLSVQDETVDFEEGLKNVIRTIMTEDRSGDEETYDADAGEEITNHEHIQEENMKEENIKEENIEEFEDGNVEEENNEVENRKEEEIGYDEELSGQIGETEPAPIKSERELAEQEVEYALYHLLEEEEMDEDDKKLRSMAEQYGFLPEELFGNFLHVKAVKKQLVKSLEGILDGHSKTVQMIITGTAGSGKTVLAKDITMFLYKTGKLKSSKIAKIKAEKLNTLELMSKKDTLKDCCLVVENVSELKRQTIDSILELCNSLKENIAVIFEEDKKNINKLFRECPRLWICLRTESTCHNIHRRTWKVLLMLA
jgi:tRNA A37 threonylcarbamoyladenosine biosynthesis protein TsaE